MFTFAVLLAFSPVLKAIFGWYRSRFGVKERSAARKLMIAFTGVSTFVITGAVLVSVLAEPWIGEIVILVALGSLALSVITTLQTTPETASSRKTLSRGETKEFWKIVNGIDPAPRKDVK